MPATLGSIARRRGADARLKRTPITTAVPRHAKTARRPNAVSSALGDSGDPSGRARSCPRARETARGRSAGSSRTTIAPTSTRSAVRLEPPAAHEGQQERDHRDGPESSRTSLNSWTVGDSNPARSGPTNSPKPVATIQGPLRLSGRRRQAISPHPANAPRDRPDGGAFLRARGDGRRCDRDEHGRDGDVHERDQKPSVRRHAKRRSTSVLPRGCASVARPVATIRGSSPLLDPDSTPIQSSRHRMRC